MVASIIRTIFTQPDNEHICTYFDGTKDDLLMFRSAGAESCPRTRSCF